MARVFLSVHNSQCDIKHKRWSVVLAGITFSNGPDRNNNNNMIYTKIWVMKKRDDYNDDDKRRCSGITRENNK